jgi:hypothetical protein
VDCLDAALFQGGVVQEFSDHACYRPFGLRFGSKSWVSLTLNRFG